MLNKTQTNHAFMFIQTEPHLKCRKQTILILKRQEGIHKCKRVVRKFRHEA